MNLKINVAKSKVKRCNRDTGIAGTNIVLNS